MNFGVLFGLFNLMRNRQNEEQKKQDEEKKQEYEDNKKRKEEERLNNEKMIQLKTRQEQIKSSSLAGNDNENYDILSKTTKPNFAKRTIGR